MRRITISLLALLMLAGSVASLGLADAQEKAKRDPIYETDGKGMQRVAEALERAKKDNKRILLKIGGNWCGWCWYLHDTFHDVPKIHKLLQSEYIVVMIDSKADDAVVQKWKISPDGYPYLTVLDSSGKKLTEQDTEPLEKGRGHDPDKVFAFLDKWKPQPLDAKEVLSAVQSQAAKEDKRIFVHFGAPWCGWCRRLDALLARDDVKKLMSQDYIDVKIDVDRMVNGKEVLELIGPGRSDGIPWYAILDQKGKTLVTSDGPQGNIGFPASHEEISLFIAMIQKTAQKLTAEQIASLNTLITEATAQFRTK